MDDKELNEALLNEAETPEEDKVGASWKAEGVPESEVWTIADTEAASKEKKTAPTKKKLVFYATVAVLLIAFAASAFLIGKYVLEGKKEAAMYEQLAQQAAASVAATEPSVNMMPGTAATEQTVPAYTGPIYDPTQILPEIKTYYEANDHTIGYIEIPDTKLNYPIVQTPDNPNYYLKRNFERNASERGAIYAWETADFNAPSDNVTLFGHNMKDGTMFASLLAYQNKEHWEKNSLINVNTLYERHTYKIFAVFKCSANLDDPTYFSYHDFTDAATKEEYEAFVNECKAKSFYDTGITPVWVDENTRDKMICLSTCEYTLDNGRFVVCAVRWT